MTAANFNFSYVRVGANKSTADQIVKPEKSRAMRRCWPSEQSRGWTLLNNPTVVHQYSTVCDRKGFAVIVGHMNRSDAEFLLQEA